MPDIRVKLGDRVRELRKARGWTQAEFADRVGLDRSYIADIERGKRNVSLLNLELLASTFRVKLHEFLRDM